MTLINIYLIAINLISFLLMGIDKLQAIFNKKRISEKTLITLAIIGGIIGTILGMYTFKHKIRKKKFLLLIPLALIYTTFYIYKNI